MIARTFRLLNAGPFRGEHELRLEPKAYAVVARRLGDPERSNWSGKSFLLEAFLAVLDGRWPKARAYDGDGWISDGEASGAISIEFNTGLIAARSKSIGKPEEFLLSTGARQDFAVQALRHHMGLSPEDIRATCYLGQRQMAQLVLSDPGEREAIVTDWLRLAPVDRAADRATKYASTLEKEAAGLIARSESLRMSIRRALNGEDREHLEMVRKRTAAAFESAKVRMKAARAAYEKVLSDQLTVKRHEELKDARQQLRISLNTVENLGEEDPSEQVKEETERLANAQAKLRQAESLVKERLTIARGEFDGRCPLAGIDCPATEEINECGRLSRKRLEEAELQAKVTEMSRREALNRLENARWRLQEVQAIHQKAQAREQRVAELEKDLPPLPPVTNIDEVREALYKSESEAEEIREEHLRLESRVRELEAAEKELRQVEQQIDAQDRKVATWREASGVIDRARRIVASTALRSIESMANRSLARVDLEMRAQWERETKNPARTCSTCGAAFLKSAKVKACERCGSARGKQMERRLDFLMSAQSGAAEDLVGIATKLAAARWLREDRQAAYAVAMLDEPTGQLDRSIRRAFTAHLPTMLSDAGFEQAFVIAHSSDVLDSLPGRIEIVSDGQWASVRVVA